MRPFFICLHDATPLYEQETRRILNELAPLVGRQISVGVVPNWHGQWPLAAHPRYCEFVAERAGEILLHGYFHQRRRGRGPVSILAESSDEMNGLNHGETSHTILGGQHALVEIFGARARGFLAPAWQRGHVRGAHAGNYGLEHVMGFFAIESGGERRIPLATWTWDCGQWAPLGNLGHGIGWMLQTIERRVPVLAIHPRDLHRGFWPRIIRLTRDLLESGREPVTPAVMLAAQC